MADAGSSDHQSAPTGHDRKDQPGVQAHQAEHDQARGIMTDTEVDENPEDEIRHDRGNRQLERKT